MNIVIDSCSRRRFAPPAHSRSFGSHKFTEMHNVTQFILIIHGGKAMYNYEKLKKQITETGTRYNPRLHKQWMPFLVLRRLAVSGNLENHNQATGLCPLQVMKNAIRGLRDVHNARGDTQTLLLNIWEPAFVEISNFLECIGAPADRTKSIVSKLRQQFSDLGFDPIVDSFYSSKGMSLRRMSRILSMAATAATEKDLHKLRAYMLKYNGRFASRFTVDLVTFDECEQFARGYHLILSSADLAGRYFATFYFRSFANHYQLSEETIANLDKSLETKAYDKDALLAVYSDLQENRRNLEPQMSLDMLGNNITASKSDIMYTSIFG